MKAWVLGLVAAALGAGCTLTNRVDEDRIPVPRPPIEICDDGIDNDDDGLTDCEDANCRDVAACQENTAEKCSDGDDNDLDGIIDCEEAECLTFAYCQEQDEASCSDREDNDHDGLVDCRESDCKGFAHCQEATEVACQDRLDNDEDGLTDCNDESCAAFFACFSTTSLLKQQGCDEPLRPALELQDTFEGGDIDGARWRVFHSAGRDRPGLYEQMLDVNGRDGFGRAGIQGVDRFRGGQDQELDVSALVRTFASRDAAGSDLTVELHSRREWGDFFADGQSVAALRLRSDGDDVVASCTYHGEELVSETGGFELVDGDLMRLAISYSAALRRFTYSVDGAEVCASPELLDQEPEASLVIHGQGPTREAEPVGAPNALMLDEVRLSVQAQQTPARCAGIGQPIVPDRFCEATRVDNAGMRSPRAVRRGASDSADWHLFPDLLRGSHAVVGHARSADGRTGWGFTPPNAAALTPDDFEDWDMGAFNWDAALGRFEAWGRGGGASASRFVSGPNDPANWSLDTAIAVDMATLELDPLAWAPETVVMADGGYIGWFSHRTRQGSRSIYRTTSDDGIAWVIEPTPVLTAGRDAAWDQDGVWAPSVTDAGGFYVMAYASERFGEPSEIGLAASRDGAAWVRHRDNPIVVGEVTGFDLDGAETPAIVVDGDGFRLWYTAVNTQVLPCEGAAPTTGQQRRIGFTALRPAP